MKRPIKLTNEMRSEALQILDRWKYIMEPFGQHPGVYGAETAKYIQIASIMDPRVFDELAIICEVKPDIIQDLWIKNFEMPHRVVQDTIREWIEKEYFAFEEEKKDEPVEIV